MKLLILSVMMVLTSAGRLQNTYLPPKTSSFTSGLSTSSNFGQQLLPGIPLVPTSRNRPVSVQIPILKLENDNNGDGTYRFSFETANHIARQETGQLKSADSGVVRGSYSYTGPDGQTYTVDYVADELGYRADASHLPTPPPIPEVILRSLRENAAEEAAVSGRAFSNQQYLPPKKNYNF